MYPACKWQRRLGNRIGGIALRAPAGQCLIAWHNPQDSQISAQPQLTVPGRPPFTGKSWQAQSGNALIANPWASQAIPFPSLSQNLKPHTTVLSLVGTSVSGVAFDGLPLLIDPNTSPVLVAASVTGKVENPLVYAAGFYLEVTFGWPLSLAQDTLNALWTALNTSTLGFAGDTSEGKKIEQALNDLLDILNCFGNLYEAAQGHLGGDPYDK